MKIRLLKEYQASAAGRMKDEVLGDYDIVWAGDPPLVVNWQQEKIFLFAYIAEGVAHYRQTDRHVTINDGQKLDTAQPATLRTTESKSND
jgi:hypothetical protein